MDNKFIYSVLLLFILSIGCNLFNSRSNQSPLHNIANRIENGESIELQELDSIKDALTKLNDTASLAGLYYFYGKHYLSINRDSALLYRKKALEIAELLNIDTLRIDLFILNSDLAQQNVDVFLTSLLKADTIAKQNKDTLRMARIWYKFGSFFFHRDQVKAENYLDSALTGFRKSKSPKDEAQCLQNMAAFEELKKENLEKALVYAQQSKDIWFNLRDTVNHAFLIQYSGVLRGKLNEPQKAKSDLLVALDLFKQSKFKPGQATCYVDLANICERLNQNDSCVNFLKDSKQLWETIGNPQRLFSVNNYLLKLSLKKEDFDNAFDLYSENLLLEKQARVHFRDKINFFQLSRYYFEQKKDKDMVALYTDELKELNKMLSSN